MLKVLMIKDSVDVKRFYLMLT